MKKSVYTFRKGFMKLYSENIIREEWKKRLESLPQSTRAELERYSNTIDITDELIMIKRKRPTIKPGDVFVVQPKEGLYFYGRVLKSNVDVLFKGGPTYQWHDSLIVCVYRCKTKRLTLDYFEPSYDNLLVPPNYIDAGAFRSGYLYKIGNVPLSEYEED